MVHAFKAARLTNNILSGSGAALLYGGQSLFFQNQTGAFYPASNPSGFITSAQAGGVQSITVTGLQTSGAITLAGAGNVYLTSVGGTITISGSGGASNLNTGAFVVTGQTGQFYAANNPSGFVTSGQLAGLNTGSFITTGQTGAFASVVNLNTTGQILESKIAVISGTTGSFITTSQTGAFASVVNLNTTGQILESKIAVISGTTGSFITTSQTGQFFWTGRLQSFVTYVPTGIDTSGISFPFDFTTVPSVQATVEVTADIMYAVAVRARTVSGYTALFSDVIAETGVWLHTSATI